MWSKFFPFRVDSYIQKKLHEAKEVAFFDKNGENLPSISIHVNPCPAE